MLASTIIDHWFQTLQTLLPAIVATLGTVAIILCSTVLLLKLLNLRRLQKSKTVLLELTPPVQTLKSPAATQRLFSILHGLDASRTITEKLLRCHITYSFEVASTRDQGIRYLMRMQERYAAIFEQSIASYLPGVKFRRTEDYLPDSHASRILEFKQTGHFAYPLHVHDSLRESDPIAYLTGSMTKLQPNELIALQVVASPVKIPEADYIAGRILGNEELLSELGKPRIAGLHGVLNAINTILFGLLDLMGEAFHGSSSYSPNTMTNQRKQEAAMKVRPARTLSTFEQELAKSVHDKLRQPLFRVSIRALVITSSRASESQRVAGIRSSLAAVGTGYQSLKSRADFPLALKGRYRSLAFVHRLPSFWNRNSILLSGAELADFYHFPYATTSKTENVITSLSRTLPAPVSLKASPDFDVLLANNVHHGEITPIGLTAAERERHVYIIGGTGNGKTTLMLQSMVQDIHNGNGMAFIDPHGDAAEALLKHIPEHRIKDVIYFNPDDLDHPVGLNLLELRPGLTGNDLLREKDLITESTISVFRKIFSEDDTGGHRIEYVLRNTIQTALTQPDATLFTIFYLLNDPKYRTNVVKTLQDPDLKNFWKFELGKAGEFQRVKMAAGITAKVGRFLFSASAKRILEQPKSTINFDDILDSGKILICNVSKGLLGEDTSELFGITVLAKIQMAALRRARLDQAKRRPYYLYVDEFQNFATASFAQLLSEARKYKLFLTMAEQSTSQQADQRLVNIVLANVGTVICFRTGNPADERLLLPQFSPYVEQGEISNLPSFNFYARLSAIKPQEPLSGETILLREEGRAETAQQVIRESRANYALKPPTLKSPTAEDPQPQKPANRRKRKAKQVSGSPVKVV
jgi:hypothetical protein